DLLKPRMKITTYNQHDVGSFAEPWSISQLPTYSAIEPTSLCNQTALAGGICFSFGNSRFLVPGRYSE
ncbi:MAG TPA: hypothetical protein VJO35_09635, partial [Terriglobales bacterium]|nr:hypothetical protein [Terriglobales bacterium]